MAFSKFLICVWLMFTSAAAAEIFYELSEQVGRQCLNKCPFQNRTDEGHLDLGCGNDCGIEQCMLGCSLWNVALETNCKTVCNVTTEVVPQKELYCVASCNGAVNNYYQLLKAKIGTPPAPALVADTLTATSLSLEWEGSQYSNSSYLVQWRYEELAGAWQYCRNQTWGHNLIVKVDNLQPYTKYRFRVAVILSERHSDPIVSAPSVVISTLPYGSPSSTPIKLRVTVVDSHRVSLSWEPGPFSNGPILSYVLRISEEVPNAYSAIKDLPALENTLFYMFQSLSPMSTYKVSVSMRNGEGEGPRASVLISTPALPIAVANQQPILILNGEHKILWQNPDMTTEPIEIYKTNDTIKGVGLHIGKELLFVSDSSGSVYKISLNPSTKASQISRPTTILTPAMISYAPLDLSVDWLNEHLYILGEVNHENENSFTRWQIVRCDFDGKSQTIAFAGFHTKPLHIEVDSYNGYLFWVQRGIVSGGLYRLDLAHISNGVKHEVTPNQILKETNLGSFTVDHTNFRIYVPLENNTLLSVSLDGREVVNFRNNTQHPMFKYIKSLSFANGLFYWINGPKLIIEEYHKSMDTYYHNEYNPDLSINRFNNILVFIRSCQPIPVAVNPPVGLQSVMGTNHAKITWHPPHLLGHQGNGAWQQWDYDLQITNSDNNSTVYRIGSTSYIAKGLKENTVYVIKAAAVTSSGVGPWSSEFTAKTLSLSESGFSSSMLWSAKEGLLKSDMTGDNIQTLIHKSHLGSTHITDISWYKDQLYLVTNTSNVMWYNMTTKTRGLMHDMDNVGSLAVDWIGKRLYWSSPKQQLITRGNLNGGNRENVPIVTVGKELKIDSLNGFIYWNTGHAIECSRLNSEHKIVYYPAQLFRKQVMGLTVDLQGKLLYWIVHGYEGSNLYKAPTADVLTPEIDISGTLVSSLSNTATMGPLCYFSDRLIWLQDDSHAVISDVMGHNKANLNSSTKAYVNMIAVVDPNLQFIPPDHESLIVIPEPVSNTSVRVSGKWNSFNVSWDLVTHVNHGQVFYEVKIFYNNKSHVEYITTEGYVSYSKGEIPPFSIVDVLVKPYTYWGAASIVRASLQSPQAYPSRPVKPRVFILHQNDSISLRFEYEVRAVFRWDKPIHANGIIRGYKVDCWFEEDGIIRGVFNDELVPPQQYEYIAKNVLKNVTYFFQVRAFNDAGYSNATDKVSALTDTETLIPRLAIAYHDSIKVVDLDLGHSHIYTISMSRGKPIDFAANLREEVVYWMNDIQEIFRSQLNETGYTKIMFINGTGVSITVDWVSRLLYWSQMENSPEQYGCTIYELDLNVYEYDRSLKIKQVLQRSVRVQKLQVSPISKSLYWIEMNQHNLGKLMMANIDGSRVGPFFKGYPNNKTINHLSKRNCNCPENPSVDKSFVLDLTERDNKVFWVDAWLKHIVVSDIEGCHCKIVINASNFYNKALPPQLMTLDSKFIYWSNTSQKQLHYSLKSFQRTNNIHTVDISTGHKIVAIGNKIQPYPMKMCLSPKQTALQVLMVNRSFNSITLELPEPVKYDECRSVNMATPFYTIYYQPYADFEQNFCNATICTVIKTFDRTLHLNGLRPFSEYIFTLSVSNYYGNIRNIAPVLGQPVILKTSAGAPMAAINVKALVVSPNRAIVKWTTPIKSSDDSSNDNDTWYEVHWRTEGAFATNQGVKEHNTFFPKTKSPHLNVTQANLFKLMPAQSYLVWVRTHSNNSDIYTDSETVSIETYPEPNNITLTSTGAYMLHVSWRPYEKPKIYDHSIEYTEIRSKNWRKIENNGSEKPDGSISYIVQKLLPKTQYKFRLSISYVENSVPYTWPTDMPFVFETLVDRPSAPGKPVVKQVSSSINQLEWQNSDAHGSSVSQYRLYADVRSNYEKLNKKSDASLNISEILSGISKPYNFKSLDNKPKNRWIMLYNGTVNYWIITNLTLSEKYIFYVQALNSIGWSSFSEPSEEFNFHEADIRFSNSDLYMLALLIIIPCMGLIAGIIGIMKCCYKGNKKAPVGQPIAITGTLRGLDVELATLRELPRSRGGGIFQHSTNILYNNGFCNPPTDADIALLPHIMRDHITLNKFLGSGAFGEVFEGKAKNLDEPDSETRVAVKTLRKGATDQEKTEFLQEAQLMSNFKHEHILSMLGVCLDNDPHFIIMELMEGGDLLSYLRARRPMLYTNDSLTLYDLLSMMRDVTKGCRYLEEMHFVHRDLACRNCLVSQQANGRIVKIGDFGLARDIYKNDYYRKEGEGLLPVRWMAVECLTDGVFSRASDVWAWAVLCWEVATLGQQPYSALLNHAVMRYVRGGGTLQRPPNCSILLFTLLQKCWNYNPEQRPTFKYCLEELDALMETVEEDATLITAIAEEPQYITVVPDGHPVDIMPQNMQMAMDIPIPTPVHPPKYLELVYDGDIAPVTQIDGYEVPRSSIRRVPRIVKSEILNGNEDINNTSKVTTVIPETNVLTAECDEVSKLIPRISFTSVPNANTDVNHISDDEKICLNNNVDEMNKLLNCNVFVKSTGLLNHNNLDSIGKTHC